MEAEVFGSMGPDKYIQERVMQYQGWYDKKAVKLKSYYLNMRTVTVIGGAVVPVLVNLNIPLKNHLTTIVSLVVVILVSLEGVYRYREQWKNYRSTEQFLGSERILFLTREGPHKSLETRQAFLVFVERVEGAIASENAATLNIMTLASEEKEASRNSLSG
ncbi:MAG: DUF4231 domain-containing protein [Terriglobia bacterium]